MSDVIGASSLALQPLDESHLGLAYFIAAEGDPAWRRVCRGGLPLPIRFGEVLWRDVFAQFVVVDSQGNPHGIAALHGVDERNRTCWAEVNVLPAQAVPPNGISPMDAERWAFDQLLQRAFETCGLRKAYIEFVEWAPPSLDDSWMATREAYLVGALYHEGRYWDTGVMTVTTRTAR